MKEIEIKVIVEQSALLIAFLAKHGVAQGESHQVDEYFTPAHRDFSAERPPLEWLRLRTEDGKQSINYKHFHRDASGKTTYCDEYETSVSDAAIMRTIFLAIDCKPLVIVRKHRRIWLYKDYEIALDSVAELGDFVEIEYRGTDDHFDRITAAMIAFLKDQGCGVLRRTRQGYPFMALFPKEIHYEIV